MELTPDQKASIALHRRIGMAEGLLHGWLALDPTDPAHIAQCQKVTREFLENPE